MLFAYAASTTARTDLPNTVDVQRCVILTGATHIHLSWRNYEIRNLAAAAATDTALARLVQSRPGESPDSLLARLERSERLRAEIGRAGLTTTQYMLVNTALFRALLTSYAMEEGRLQQVPPGENAADVMFVQRNGQEIRRMVARTRMDLLPLVGEIGAPPPPGP